MASNSIQDMDTRTACRAAIACLPSQSWACHKEPLLLWAGYVTIDRGCALAQAHELNAGCLGALAVATQLTSLSLEGIPRMGTEGWAAVAAMHGLTRLAVRSRGDNAGLGQVRAHAHVAAACARMRRRLRLPCSEHAG